VGDCPGRQNFFNFGDLSGDRAKKKPCRLGQGNKLN